MRITTLASSSSGNCALVSHGGAHILIDAGISYKRIRGSLRELGVEPGEISAVLVTHSHSDHINGLGIMTKYIAPRIFATRATLDAIENQVAGGSPLEVIEPGVVLDAAGFGIRAFRTSHDAPGSVGFTVSAGGRTLAFATDLGIVTEDVLTAASGADLAVVEANHDITMLKFGNYPPSLRRRIASEMGHLSNLAGGALALELAKSGARKIILAHLSRENNTPELAYRDVRDALSRGGADVGGDVELTVAPPDTPCGTLGV